MLFCKDPLLLKFFLQVAAAMVLKEKFNGRLCLKDFEKLDDIGTREASVLNDDFFGKKLCLYFPFLLNYFQCVEFILAS